MEILILSITVFIVQLVMIFSRTWNIIAISKENVKQVLLSGIVIHTCWLLTISIGSKSMYEIIGNFEFKYLPVIFCSLAGGLLGSYIGLKRKVK